MAGPSPADVKSVAEHWDILWIMVVGLSGVAAGLFGVINFLIWRIIIRIEKSIEKIYDCMANMTTRAEFTEWKQGRHDLIRKLECHSHAPDGSVTFYKS